MSYLQEIRNYWNSRSEGFSGAVREELETVPGKMWRQLFAQQLPQERCKILDLGAGAGFFTVLLASLGHKVTAVDYSEKMLEEVRENLRVNGLEAVVLRMDAQKLEFSDHMFDAVVSRNVLWNLENPKKGYQEIFRVLKPGGLLILEDGNYYLHLKDPMYASLKKEKEPDEGCHERHNVDHVDFKIMEQIAEHLPLSSRRRPQWDMEQLLELGFSDIRVQTDYRPLPERFLITAEKRREPVCGEKL